MAGHLVNQGYNLSVFNRTASKADELVAKGATFKDPIEIAKEVDYLFLTLGYPEEVENLLLHHEIGLLKHMKPGALVVDHSTVDPKLSKRVAEEAAKHQVRALDAPVTGGDVGAINGKLTVMAGGNEADFTEIKPLLESYSAQAELMGPHGMGQHCKAAN